MQREMTVRICATCEKPLKFQADGTQEGIYCCDEYYHEGECIEASFKDGETWEQHYLGQSDDEQLDCYYTEWEPEFTDDSREAVRQGRVDI